MNGGTGASPVLQKHSAAEPLLKRRAADWGVVRSWERFRDACIGDGLRPGTGGAPERATSRRAAGWAQTEHSARSGVAMPSKLLRPGTGRAPERVSECSWSIGRCVFRTSLRQSHVAGSRHAQGDRSEHPAVRCVPCAAGRPLDSDPNFRSDKSEHSVPSLSVRSTGRRDISNLTQPDSRLNATLVSLTPSDKAVPPPDKEERRSREAHRYPTSLRRRRSEPGQKRRILH